MTTSRAIVLALVSAALAATGAVLITTQVRSPASERSTATYVCPMHPSVTQDHRGQCPICSMKLVKADAAPTTSAPTLYTCPMHPSVTQDHPGQCPICNMKLVKAETTAAPSDALAVIAIDPAHQQLIGLERGVVDHGALGGALRTAARIGVDETQVRTVSLRVPGYVERLFVDFIGKPVRKGQPLFSLFSPEVLAAEQEWLVAQRGGATGLAASARRKLELWGVPESELARLEREGVASQTITFTSPVSGVVTKKAVVEGARLEAGAMPFEVTDLSSVWVLADVYETELRFVTPGLTARFSTAAFPGRTFEGVVRFLDPVVDPMTRTSRVRVALPNTDGALKPELFGELVIERPRREVLRVPSDALVRGGQRDFAFVARADGHFEPREVVVGEVTRDFAEVLEGLEAGEAVVTRATFLVESESKLRASLARLASTKATPPAATLEPEHRP